MTEQQFDKNTWQTPKWLFRWLEQRFYWFHIDGCSNGLKALTTFWIEPTAEGLDDDTLSGQVADAFLSDDLFARLVDFVEIQKLKFRSNAEYWLITDLYARNKKYSWKDETLRNQAEKP